MNKTALVSFSILCLIFTMFVFEFRIAKANPGIIHVPADHQTIQEAINNANQGDVIRVNNGTYHENVVVNKTVSIIGESSETTIVNGGGSNTVTILANNVTISGFTIRNGWSGIFGDGYNGTKITDNTITANIGTGVGDGLYIMNSHGIIISRNIISGNTEDGLTLAPNTTDSLVSENIIVLNGGAGVYMHSSDMNMIIDNNVTLNSEYGVYMFDSFDNQLQQNSIASNKIGFLLHSSSRNIIKENAIVTNLEAGFRFFQNSIPTIDNEIYHNYINNEVQVQNFAQSGNKWDNGYSSGGNYWSDFNGVDFYSGSYQNETGSDGIADTPYVIDKNNQDNYPLMYPYSLFQIISKMKESIDNLTMTFNSTRDNLQAQINSINNTCVNLNQSIISLQEQYNSLNDQANTILNVLYVLAALTVVLMVTTIYSAMRKPKAKPETEKATKAQ